MFFFLIAVSFRCDESGQWEESPNQEDRCSTSCEVGWTEFREYCYKTEMNNRLNFTNAIEACAELVSFFCLESPLIGILDNAC